MWLQQANTFDLILTAKTKDCGNLFLGDFIAGNDTE